MVWFPKHDEMPDWSAAEKFLSEVDPALGKIIAQVGPCRLHPRRDYFVLMCLSIFNQQIALKTAETLFARFSAKFPKKKPTPTRVRDALKPGGWDEQTVRHCGISRQKRVYLHDLAEHFLDGRIPVRKLPSMTDDEVIACLTDVKGVGRWTAEMFLMFVLNRPDVLPVDDLAFQEGVKQHFNLAERPRPKAIIPLAEPWRPWRTVATWYLWKLRHLSQTEAVEPLRARRATEKSTEGKKGQAKKSSP